MISRLRKLKGRSLAELAERGRQKAGALAERIGASADLKVPSDIEFLRFFAEESFETADHLLHWFRSRPSKFYPSFDNETETVAAFRERFSVEEECIVASAERACSGRFDLLGYNDLYFGGQIPDWQLEPVSGKRSPMRHWSRIDETDPEETGDKKITWELNRHQYFTVLGRAYWLTADERYANCFIAHIGDWIDKNPPKMGLNWMSSLEIAYRSISWIWGCHFFRNSDSFGLETFLRILKALYINGRHIERNLSTYSSPNTHLTGEALGLYAIGSFLPGTKHGERWKALGYDILVRAAEFQIRDDGGYVEQATVYHRYTADIYLSLLILRKTEGLPLDEQLETRLRALLRFLLQATQPNGETPLVGDDDGGRLHFLDNRGYADFRSTLAVGAALLNDGELKFAAGEPSSELLWLAGPMGLEAFDQIESTRPDDLFKEFKSSGLYVVRDGWDRHSNFMLIDCGVHGFLNGAHAHADALGFVMSVKGEPVFVDSGTYNYTADKAKRDYFRSSAAHNCLTVNGQSSSNPGGPFSWQKMANSKMLEWSSDPRETVFRGTHDGFERLGVKYEREILFESGGETFVTESIQTEAKNSFELHLIMSPETEAEVVGEKSVIVRGKQGNRSLLTIDTKLDQDLEYDGWKVEKALISPRYGSLVETTKLLFTVRADRNFQIINHLKPVI